MSNIKIDELIERYAKVYADFEAIQQTDAMPKGDQKTGVIGEYYAKCYVENLTKVENAAFAKSGEAFDLKYCDNGKCIKVQVKCVSAHSKSRIIAPLNLDIKNGYPFDYIYLIDLDLNFKPIGFYINTFEEIKLKTEGKDKIVSSKMKGICPDGKLTNGSSIYNFENNLIEELRIAIDLKNNNTK